MYIQIDSHVELSKVEKLERTDCRLRGSEEIAMSEKKKHMYVLKVLQKNQLLNLLVGKVLLVKEKK